MRAKARARASDHVDLGVSIAHLHNAIVELEMVRAAGPNNPTRQNLANARAQVGAVIGTIQLLEAKAFHEPR